MSINEPAPITSSTHSDQLIPADDAKSEKRGASVKIYTKTGDLGYTSLLGCGDSVPKWHKKIRAYGAVDELNSHLGQVHEVMFNLLDLDDGKSKHIGDKFITSIDGIQQILFVASSWLSRADYKSANVRPELNELTRDFIEELEDDIDQMSSELPPLCNFIQLSGAGTSTIHVARSVCRRAESEVADAIYSADAIEYGQYSLIMVYLNRLSDWLFTLARSYSRHTGQNEVAIKSRTRAINNSYLNLKK